MVLGRHRSPYLKPRTTLNVVQEQGHANTFDFDPIFPSKIKRAHLHPFLFFGQGLEWVFFGVFCWFGGVFSPAIRKGSVRNRRRER